MEWDRAEKESQFRAGRRSQLRPNRVYSSNGRAGRLVSSRACFCVEPLAKSGCGVRRHSGRSRWVDEVLSSDRPGLGHRRIARRRRGTCRDRMTSVPSRSSLAKPLAELDQGLGQECVCDEPFGRLNTHGHAARMCSRVDWSSQPMAVTAIQ